MSEAVTFALPPEVVEAIAERAAEIVLDRIGERDDDQRWPEWMPLDVAASYMGQSVAATRKLYERRRVPHYQDGVGAKVWLRRSELDAHISSLQRKYS